MHDFSLQSGVAMKIHKPFSKTFEKGCQKHKYTSLDINKLKSKLDSNMININLPLIIIIN